MFLIFALRKLKFGVRIWVVIQIRDYRKATSQQGPNAPVIDSSPVITKVRLKTSLENVVRDIPLISEGSWTYGDLLVSWMIQNSLWS